MASCGNSCNARRRRCGAKPISLNVNRCSMCSAYLKTLGKGRRMLQGTEGARRQLEVTDDGCFRAVFENKSSDPVTSEMAMTAWYAQGKYFDYETGIPQSGYT